MSMQEKLGGDIEYNQNKPEIVINKEKTETRKELFKEKTIEPNRDNTVDPLEGAMLSEAHDKNDQVSWLAYADWLDERGDEEKRDQERAKSIRDKWSPKG